MFWILKKIYCIFSGFAFFEVVISIPLLSTVAWKSSFVLDYVIEGIPRFILIDKNGNIISSNAPRPATFNKGNYLLNEEIQTIFDENL